MNKKYELTNSDKNGLYPKVLITSFKGKNNSSSLLLNIIKTNGIDKLELTNSFITSENEIKSKINKNNYKYIISFGQKPNCNHINIELFGIKNDNMLENTFPYKDLMAFLEENNIKYSISKNAGNYLCNNIYYESMKYIKDNAVDIKVIFIHVPSINMEYDFDETAKVLSNFIESLVSKEKF